MKNDREPDPSAEPMWTQYAHKIQSDIELREFPRIPIANEQPQLSSKRGVALLDRLAGFVLSGFVPALFLCIPAAVFATQYANRFTTELSSPLAYGIAILACLPLGWLASPLFVARQTHLLRFIPLGLLTAGAAALVSVLPNLIYRRQVGIDVSDWEAVSLFQSHLESYLRYGSWALTVAAATLAFFLVRWTAEQCPWNDPPSVGRVRDLVAWVPAALIPLTLLTLCGDLALEQHPNVKWFNESLARSPLPPKKGQKREEMLWSALSSTIEPSQARQTTNILNDAAKTEVHKFESRALAIWQRPDHGISTHDDLRPAFTTLLQLSERQEALLHPDELLHAVLSLGSLYRPENFERSAARTTAQVLLPQLADGSSTRNWDVWRDILDNTLAKLEPTSERLNGDVAEAYMDLIAGRGSRDLLQMGKIRPLRAFGYTFDHSPVTIRFHLEAVKLLGPWLEKRSAVDPLNPSRFLSTWPEEVEKQATPQKRWLRSQPDLTARSDSYFEDPKSPSNVSRYCLKKAIDRQYTETLRPTLRLARLVLELRNYQQRTGKWPVTLSVIADKLPFDLGSETWSYRVENGAVEVKLLDSDLEKRVSTTWRAR